MADMRNITGKLNKRVSFYVPTITPDSIGNRITTFDYARKAWAMVQSLNESEYNSPSQEKSITVTRFIVRYSKALGELFATYSTSFQIEYKEARYDVTSVINDDEQNNTFAIIAECRR